MRVARKFQDWLLAKFSPSKLNCFTSCPRKAYYKYIRKLRDPFGLHFATGKAAHEGFEADNYGKIDGAPLKLREVHEVGVESFVRQTKAVEDLPAGNLVDAFADEYASQLEAFEKSGERDRIIPVPGTVEAAFQIEMEVEGEPALLEAYTDVVSLDEYGRRVAVDLKTAGRPIGADEASEHMQLALEAIGAEAEAARIVTFVKHKKQKPTAKVTPDVEIRQEHRDRALNQVGQTIKEFREAHKKDFWPKRNQGSLECSYCPFYGECWPTGPGVQKLVQVMVINPAGSLPAESQTWRESETAKKRREKSAP